MVPRKASKLQSYETVPQTDTGGRDEYSKALERTREKELGNIVTSEEGVPLVGEGIYSWSPMRLQEIGGCDCLLKTQHSANTKVDV